MSIDALSWAWKQEVDTPVSKVILLCLATHAAEGTSEACLYLKDIAALCSCYRSTVIRQLRWLIEQGYITPMIQARVGVSPVSYRVNHDGVVSAQHLSPRLRGYDVRKL